MSHPEKICCCGTIFPAIGRRWLCADCRRVENRKVRAAIKQRRANGEIAPHEQLLFGPYLPPDVKSGDFLFDERFGLVPVGGYSDSPLPWPYNANYGKKSLILHGDLVRAVRQESELAVSYWFGVSITTVWKWRKALGVERMTLGTTEAYRAVMPDKLPPEIIAVGRKKLSTHEVRAKMSKTRTGQPAPPPVKAGLLRAAKAPKSEDWKKQHSERLREQWANGTRNRTPVWTDERKAELLRLKAEGKTDRECSEIMGAKIQSIRDTRKNRHFSRKKLSAKPS